MQSDAIASLQRIFDCDVAEPPTLPQISAEEQEPTDITEFNLYSTGSGLSKVSLTESPYQVPLVNRTRPREYYFPDPYRLGNLII